MAISIYDPRTMDQVVRILPSTGGWFRDTFFSRHMAVPGEKVDVDFYKGKRKIAPFVNPKSAGRAVEKTGYKTNTFTPPLLKPKDTTTIEDLSVRLPGEALYGGFTREDRALQLLTEKLEEFNNMNIRREEWMCATAMLKGYIPIKGEGVDYVIDFGFTNKETLSGGNLWSSNTADPLADIDRWVLTCQQNGYRTPNVCLMERTAYDKFMARLIAKSALNQLSQRLELVTLNPRQLNENVIYGGTILKYNMDIYIYNEWYLDDWTDPSNPTEQPLVPTGAVMLASTNARAATYYAELTIADENSATGFRSIIGERIADTWIEKDPPKRFLTMHSRPLPCPQEVDSWYVATVL